MLPHRPSRILAVESFVDINPCFRDLFLSRLYSCIKTDLNGNRGRPHMHGFMTVCDPILTGL